MIRIRYYIYSLIVYSILYVATFRLLALVIEVNYQIIELFIMIVIILEQTFVPFLFGFLFVAVIKPVYRKELLLVLVMPCALLVASLCVDYLENGKLTVISKLIFYLVALSQFVFVLLGGYVRYKIFCKKKYTGN